MNTEAESSVNLLSTEKGYGNVKKKMLAFLAVVIVLDIIALSVMFFTRDNERVPIKTDAPVGTS